MKKFIVFITAIVAVLSVLAQTPQVPSGQPGKIALPAPRLKPLKADLIFIEVKVISVVVVESRRLFETKLSITLKNQGSIATSTGFYLDLRSRYGTTSGGTDYSMIGALATVRPLAAGETRTVEYVFAKDITAMGRGRHECVIRLDPTNLITESNEENNRSPFFDITTPER